MKQNKKRWLYAVNGMVALLFLGLIYAWSVFVGPLEAEFGWLRSQTSLTFSISMAAFCFGCIAGGVLARKLAARLIMCVAACFVLAGFTISSFISSLLGLYLGYGVLCGFGVGVGYNAVLGSVLAWFPDKQGLLSGVLLMGFGFGGSVLGSLAVALMNRFGWRFTFRALGVALGLLLVVSSLLLKKPVQPLQATKISTGITAEDLPTGQMVRRRSFWAYFIWSVLLSSAGLALIGSAASFAGSFTANLATATFVAGLINVFNGIGRLCFGFLFDIVGSKRCLFVITAGLLAAVAVLMGAIVSGSLLVLGAGFVLAGFFYGGITPSNSAYVGKVFGQKYYATNFSVVNMVLLVAAFLGPYGSGFLQTASGGYFSTIVLLAVFCVAGFIPLFLINQHAPAKTTKSKTKTNKSVEEE